MIRLVFHADLFIIERLMTERNLHALSPLELLAQLEEMLDSGELTTEQIQEIINEH